MLLRASGELAELHLDAACEAVLELLETLAEVDGRLEQLAPLLDALEQHLLLKANMTLDQLTRAEREWAREVRYNAASDAD
jgi:hypothetical protein